MAKFSHIFHAKSDDEIKSSISKLAHPDLIELTNEAAQNVQINVDVSRWSKLSSAALTVALGIAVTALTYPIAKWRNYSDRGFLKYMTHPVSLLANGVSLVSGIVSHYLGETEGNSIVIEKLSQKELERRVEHSITDTNGNTLGKVNLETAAAATSTAPQTINLSHAQHNGISQTSPQNTKSA